MWFLATIGLFVALLAWFAPLMVAKSPLRQQLVPMAMPELECPVHIGSASLWWFSNITLSDVEVRDPSGEIMLVVREIRSEKTLADLLQDTSRLGRFHIEGPQAKVMLRADGSNVQDALEPLLAPTEEPASPMSVAVHVTEGRIDVIDEVTGRKLHVDQLNLDFDKPLNWEQPLKGALAGVLHADGHSSSIQTAVSWAPPPASEEGALGSGEVNVVLDKLMLASVQPVLEQAVTGIRVGGQLSTSLKCRFSGNASRPDVRANGRVDAIGLAVAAPDWLGPKPLQADRIALDGRVTTTKERLELKLDGGQVNLTDTLTKQTLQLADLRAQLQQSRTDEPIVRASLGGTIRTDGQEGSWRADVVWTPPADGQTDQLGNGDVKLGLSNFMLAAARPVLQRMAPGVHVEGQVSSGVHCVFRGDVASPTVEATAQVKTRGFVLDAPEWLGEDVVRTETLNLDSSLALSNGQLQLKPAKIHADVGDLLVSGSVSLDALAEKPWLTCLIETLRTKDYQLEAGLDVTRLAQMLPNTLRVRENTRITSGQILVNSTGYTQNGTRQWTGSMATKDLAGITSGRRVSWPEPLTISLKARDAKSGIAVDELLCKASFVDLTASGTLRDARLHLRGDLDRFVQELDRFFDLGQLKMAGSVEADLTCQRIADERIDARGTLAVQRLEFTMPGQHALTEPRLDMQLAATAAVDDTGIRRIDRAQVTLAAGSDRGQIQLVQPVANPASKASWPLAITLSGKLKDWCARLQPWVPVADWDVSGNAEITATVDASPAKITIHRSNARFAPLHAHSRAFSVYVDDPDVRVQLAGTWDADTYTLTTPAAMLSSTALHFNAKDTTVQLQEKGLPTAAGDLVVRGDLGRLMQWTNDPQVQPTQFVGGLINGNVSLALQGGRTQAQWSVSGSDLIYAELQAVPPPPALARPGSNVRPVSANAQWTTLWGSQELTSDGTVQYDHTADTLQISGLGVASDTVQVTADGTIERLTTLRQADLAGEVEYDLEKLTPKLKPMIGSGVTLKGREKRKFVVRGPLVFHAVSESGLAVQPGGVQFEPVSASSAGPVGHTFQWPHQLTGTTGFGWSGAEFYGLPVGSGGVDARVAESVLATTPLDFSVSGGRVRLVPRVELGTTPMTLFVEPGRVVENVQITDEMCRVWLKFVAPLFADATRIDGRFSLDLTGAKVPLATPETSDVAGTLHLDNAKLRPGPLVDRFVFLVQQVQAVLQRKPIPSSYSVPNSGLVEIDRQAVPFQVVDGRVYHRDLTLNVRGVRIRTSGSVGVDQSIDLVAHVPIHDDWIRGDGLLASLRGQTIQVPIRGQLSQPKFDESALTQLGRRIAEGAAGRLIERGLEQGLDRALEGIFRQ